MLTFNKEHGTIGRTSSLYLFRNSGHSWKERLESTKRRVKGWLPYHLVERPRHLVVGKAGRRLCPSAGSGRCLLRALLPLGSSPVQSENQHPLHCGQAGHNWHQHQGVGSLLVATLLRWATAFHRRAGPQWCEVPQVPGAFFPTWEALSGLSDCMSKVNIPWEISLGLLLPKSEPGKGAYCSHGPARSSG